MGADKTFLIFLLKVYKPQRQNHIMEMDHSHVLWFPVDLEINLQMLPCPSPSILKHHQMYMWVTLETIHCLWVPQDS